MQDVFLFSDTIEENIKLGAKNSIEEEAVSTAAKDAQASEFIDKMDGRLETVIGEKGGGLSGGQKQRVAISRESV